jgi:hypothetical protein
LTTFQPAAVFTPKPVSELVAAALVAAALGLIRTVIVLVIVEGGSVSVETADMIAASRD